MGMIVRPMRLDDRAAVSAMLQTCGVFTPDEIAIALMLIDEGLSVSDDYFLYIAEELRNVLGYVCVGKTPLTESTWHLYWICVDPSSQRKGVGKLLQLKIEEFVRSERGQRIVLETSSQNIYDRPREFYRHAGYEIVGQIRDFYKTGDDCIIFCKKLLV
jgi:ribosomal protein S18 acetylase RimI-like enzyme